MDTILVTGFEPFGGDARNPSQEIAHALHRHRIRRAEIVGATLPCTFAGAARTLRQLLHQHRPSLVVGLGLAATRVELTPERVAINVDDARIPDNAGRQPLGTSIVKTGPVAYWSTLPIHAIVRDLSAAKIPASVSQTAGTFVCNHAFYLLMHELRRSRSVRGGFIHLPWPADWQPRHLTGATLTFEQLLNGVCLAIETSLKVRRDARTRGGSIS